LKGKASEADAGLPRAAWADLDVLCLRAMQGDVAKRYGSVEALMRDVEHFLNNEPLDARPDSAVYKLGKFVKRNRRAVLAACLFTLLIVGGTAAFLWRLEKARNAALAEAARTRRIQQFLEFLIRPNGMSAAPEKDLRVVTLLDRGVAHAQALEADPETQGDLYEELGSMYDKLGEYPKADQLVTLALDRKRRALPGNDPSVANTLLWLGVVKADELQFKEAEADAQQAVTLEERELPASDPRLIDAKSTLGRVVAEEGDSPRAIALLEPLITREAHGLEEESTLSGNLNTLGVAEYSVGHVEKALAADQRGLELDRRLHGNRHPQVATDLQNLGQVKRAQGLLPEAVADYREAVAILEAAYAPDHIELATARGVLARMLAEEGKDDEAQSMLGKVLATQEVVYHGADPHLAVTLDTMGRMALKHGNAQEAEARFSRAAEMDRSTLGRGNYQTAIILSDLGKAYLAEGRNVDAEKTLGKAVKILEENPAPSPLGLAGARTAWGEALLVLKRYADARVALEAAEQVSEQAKAPAADVARVRGDLEKVKVREGSNETNKKQTLH
jgi:tetratricopeptide (TPR) repeat protein